MGLKKYGHKSPDAKGFESKMLKASRRRQIGRAPSRLGGLGEYCKLPQKGVAGGAQAKIKFGKI